MDYMDGRCKRCFGLKPIQALKGTDLEVCKGCFYEAGKIIDFLQAHGLTLVSLGTGELTPDPAVDASNRRERPPKGDKGS